MEISAHKRFCVKLIHCGNINPVNREDNKEKSIFFMPMGIFPLANVLKEKGFDVEIIHMDLESNRPLDEILEIGALDAVGFDCFWINQSLAVLDTAKFIKEINPGVFIFLGGFSASLFAGEITANYSQVDAVIRGDAEVPIVELCTALHRQESPHRVQNLVWKDKNKVKVNQFTYVGSAADMNELDFAALHLLRNFDYYRASSRFYTDFSPIRSSPMFSLEVGRGCPYACTFCGGNCEAQKRLSSRGQVAVRSHDSIVDTIKKAVSYGYETFYSCLEFEHSDEWYIELFRRIKEENLDIIFVYGSWRLPSPSLIDALAASFRHALIEISPETGDISLRRKNKDHRLFYTNEQLEEILQCCQRKSNVKIQLFFGYYLAGDSEKSVLKTMAYILQLLARFPGLLEIDYAEFSPDPGSLYFFEPGKYNMDAGARHFEDYVNYLKETFLEVKDRQMPPILFKPGNLTFEADIKIRGKIRLFNHLLSAFRKSVSHIIKQTGSGEVIISILKENNISLFPGESFSPGEIGDILLESCDRRNILDKSLVKCIISDTKQSKSRTRLSGPTTLLHLDFDLDGIWPGHEPPGAVISEKDARRDNACGDENMDVGFYFE